MGQNNQECGVARLLLGKWGAEVYVRLPKPSRGRVNYRQRNLCITSATQGTINFPVSVLGIGDLHLAAKQSFNIMFFWTQLDSEASQYY